MPIRACSSSLHRHRRHVEVFVAFSLLRLADEMEWDASEGMGRRFEWCLGWDW